MFYTNLATGQKLSECDFYAYITSTDWSCCGSDEQVWIGQNRALTTTEWFAYFSTNTPACADVAPTCMPVVIKGGDNVGDTLTVTSWNVSGIPAPLKSYQWQESSNGGITWTPIGTGTSYTLVSTNVGKLVRVEGTATNTQGTTQCQSAPVTVYPAYEAPTEITGPTITGSSSLGSILTCNPGTYNGFPSSFAFSFQWYRGSLPISGETSSTYKIKISDSSEVITCHVSINNGVPPALQLVSNTITANYFGPVNTVPPVVSGSTSLAGILTCTTGSWNGPNLSYTYQWYVDGVEVGNDNNSLQLILAWSNKDIKCLVTATNSIDSVSVFSNIVTAGDFSPVNTLAPVISVVGGGPANPGTTIATSNGNWQGNNLSFSYQWFAGATPIGSDQSTYQVQNSDTGQNITCVVSATNLGGTGSATSNVIAVPSGPGVTPPSNSTAPTITVASGGPVLAGKSLVCNVGVWLGTAPILYSYEWFRGATSVGIGVSYTMVLADIGQPLKCVVTGTNGYGVATANSNILVPTGQVSLPPSNIVAPMIYVANGGLALAGKALSVDIGAWDGTSPITYSYQWYSNASPVGVDDPSYIMQSSDIGNTITCVVTGTNAINSANATSNGIPVIGTIYVAPSNITPPSISTCGPAIVGTCLSSNIGTWDGDDVNYAFEWFSGVTMVAITENYQLQASDYGLNIILKVTATNLYGTAVATTSAVTCVDVPKNTATPSISGTLVAGNTLTCSPGTWSGNTPITYGYQWQRNGVNISGATSNTYTSVSNDIGNNIACIGSASNIYGPGLDEITSSVIVTGAPSLLQSPVIYGQYTEGGVLTVQDGYYSGYPTPTISSRKWQFSTDGGSTWNDYSPAQTASTYTVQTGEAGRLIRVQETASNSVGTSVNNSNSASIMASGGVQRPEISVAPVISGNDWVGETLTTTDGTWLYSPTGYSYQWYRNGTTPIGTNTNTYTLVTADIDAEITCEVTATNAGGSQEQISNEVYIFDADFQTLKAQANSLSYALPSTAQQKHFNKMLTELKASGFFQLMDVFYWFANNGSAGFGRLNWVTPASFECTAVNAPSWASNSGYTFTGSQYIDTNFNPATSGVNYTQNDAGRYIYITRKVTTTNQRLDGNSIDNDNRMFLSTSNVANNINSGTTNPSNAAITNQSGLQSIVRTSASAVNRYVDLTFAENVASSGITSQNQWIGRSGPNYGNFAVKMYAMGGAIPSGDYFSFKEIIDKYMNSLP